MARVFFPPQLRDLTRGCADAEVAGSNLRQVVAALDEAFPGFAARVLRDGKLTPGLAVAIDNEVTTLGLFARVEPQSHVHFLAAIAGG